jgi:hypothetical protein
MSSTKSQETRDCERSCNSLFIPGFKEHYGHSTDPTCFDKNEKNERNGCFIAMIVPGCVIM